MRRKLALLIAGILMASGTSLLACSGGDTVPDELPSEPPQYQSTNDEGEIELAQQEGQSAQQPSQGAFAVGPVATVNGEEIPAEAFNEQAAQLQAAGAQVPPELIAHLQQQIIEELINRHLLQGAIAQADIEVSDEQVEARLEEFRQEFAQEEMTFDEVIAQMGMSPDDLREVVAETVAIETLLQQQGMSTPSQEEVRSFYDENPEYFTQDEAVQARHILIRVMAEDSDEAWEEARQEAEQIRREITEDGVDFAEMARTHSDDGSAQAGGELGQLPRGATVPEFEEAAFALEPSEISEPVRSEFGWHIIQVTDRQEAGSLEFSEVEEQLTRDLEREAMQESLDVLLTELRANATVEIHAENIQ